MSLPDIHRRRLLRAITSLPIAVTGRPAGAAAPLVRRPIPGRGEALPVIGLGTYIAFDFPRESPQEMADGMATLLAFLNGGGRLIDSSPMYGEAEVRIGEGLRHLGRKEKPFFATKVWTTGEAAGKAQMEESFRRLGTGRLDLMQIHNLVDVATHLKTLRAWQQAGRIRYLGITHYHAGAHEAVEEWLKKGHFEFLQINYSLLEREAENRLLPYCLDKGIAVIVNRPLAQGALLERVRGRSLPPWAAEIGCTSWAQLFLKWIVAHPAVTCVIPATRKARHMEDNLLAGLGPMPDEALRKLIGAAISES